MNARQKDPNKEAALWAAIRALDGGTRRAVEGHAGKPSDRGSWHEKDARRILFLKHRYDAGEWRGEADCGQSETAVDEPPVLAESITS